MSVFIVLYLVGAVYLALVMFADFKGINQEWTAWEITMCFFYIVLWWIPLALAIKDLTAEAMARKGYVLNDGRKIKKGAKKNGF